MTKLLLNTSACLVTVSLMSVSGAALARDLRQDAVRAYQNKQNNAKSQAATKKMQQKDAITNVQPIGLIPEAQSRYSTQQANAPADPTAPTAQQMNAINNAPNVGLVGAARSAYSAQQANASAQATQHSQAVSAAIGRASAAANNHR